MIKATEESNKSSIPIQVMKELLLAKEPDAVVDDAIKCVSSGI